ncbi:MAG: magnesium/cobalt transporter CorA [Candidatus Bathyarchaeota archaeon]|nr:magnesium/cobalt transporter CorA [Candidatus Bathyarchaeota archaeon]
MAFRGWSKKAGSPPGTVVYVGEQVPQESRVRVMGYSERFFEEKEVSVVEDVFAAADKAAVSWINVDGLQGIDVIERLGRQFNVHPLVLEDIVNTNQRPKIEDFTDHLYIVLRMLRYDKEANEVISEQLSLLLGANWVISFQETEGDVFDNIRDRIKNSKGKIRKSGADYLAYALIDAVVDNYFSILENIGETVEDIEDELLTNPQPTTLKKIHGLKRQILLLRKSIWPLREVANAMERGESKLINKTTSIYLRDVYDHTIQVIDAVETFRDMLSGMLDIYLSSVSNKMNEVMKVLTIIATIFIPLTFIAGIYGMNFQNMPELTHPLGYPLVLAAMLAIAVLMLLYFRKKKWIL